MRRINQILIFGLILIFNFQFSIFNCSAQQVELKRERTFAGAGLYGFMNGGADQFLEYGVQQLVTRDLVYEGEEYTIEIYEMPSPEEAFGIYSLHTFRCQRADTLDCIDCLSPYQLQAVSANKYISVVFPSGSRAAMERVDELIRMYVPLGNEYNPQIPSLLKLESPYSGRLKYLKGPLSVSAASFSFSKLVEGLSYTGVWFVSQKPSKDYRALVYFSDRQDVERIKERIPASSVLEVGNDYIYLSGGEGDDSEEDFGGFGF
ncbi:MULTISPECIES: DUF6599 family protein [unclassified Parabacteroides]|uniref:DUF6599 family protein n=1 Tax=unclassified Parabacteroides TaxID=2649774 RepID=UPI00247702AE|nr:MULTISPECIES: DUF6599 family protein [unclassified Parabacteroides]